MIHKRRFMQRLRFLLRSTVWLVLIAGATGASAAANPDALWQIVHDQCVPNAQQHSTASPCEAVSLQDGVEKGFVILKDLAGATQFLLIPTARIPGIESPELLAASAPNYWDAAWQARAYVEARARKPLARDAVGLAVNSAAGRTQNQLHIHVSCVRPEIRTTLLLHEENIGDGWTPLTVPLGGHEYRVRRAAGPELGEVNPFKLLADGLPAARQRMGQYALVVVGATFRDGREGFYLLTHPADPRTGDPGSGEELLDLDCAQAP